MMKTIKKLLICTIFNFVVLLVFCIFYNWLISVGVSAELITFVIVGCIVGNFSADLFDKLK